VSSRRLGQLEDENGRLKRLVGIGARHADALEALLKKTRPRPCGLAVVSRPLSRRIFSRLRALRSVRRAPISACEETRTAGAAHPEIRWRVPVWVRTHLGREGLADQSHARASALLAGGACRCGCAAGTHGATPQVRCPPTNRGRGLRAWRLAVGDRFGTHVVDQWSRQSPVLETVQ